mmetsp:Transcript_48718/g.127108  ORF Transcript_48718/g.127108 Transcript_48718/m.127108 type:complete len:219 (+) Transcript_48718:3-659(+)
MSGFKWTSGGGTPRASLSSPPWPACTRPEEAEADDAREATCSASNRFRQAASRAQRLPSRRGPAASFSWRARKSTKSVCKRARTGAFLGSLRSTKPPSKILITSFRSRDCRVLRTRPMAASSMGSAFSSELLAIARGGVKAATAEYSKEHNSFSPTSKAAGSLLSRSATKSSRALSSTTAQRLASCWKRRANLFLGTPSSVGNAHKSSDHASRESASS